MVFLYILLLIALLLASGEVFVKSVVAFCKRFNVSPFFVGSVIVAIGTSSPDLFVSIVSTMRGHYEVSVASLIGSAVANILLCIGVASIFLKFSSKKSVPSIAFGLKYYLVFILLFVVFLFFSGGKINLLFSVFLVSASIFFIFCIFKFEDNVVEGDTEKNAETAFSQLLQNNFYFAALCFLVGIIGLTASSNILLNCILSASGNFDIPKKVISSIIIAPGNSMPEIITTIIMAKKGHYKVALGNVIGSNIFILGMVLGFTSLISILKFAVATKVALPLLIMDMPFLVICSIITFMLFKSKMNFNLRTGLIFVFLYLSYVLLQVNII